MKLPRPRFTLRWLMVAVAIVAIGLGAERMMTLRANYRRKASFHESRLSILSVIRDRGERLTGPSDRGRSVVNPGQAARRHSVHFAHHEALRRKYEAAASRPWLPVVPDPAEPE